MIGLPLLLAQLIVSTAKGTNCDLTQLPTQPPKSATLTYAASRLWAVNDENLTTYLLQDSTWEATTNTTEFRIIQVAGCPDNQVYSVSMDGSFRRYNKTIEAWSEPLPTTAKKLTTISCGVDGVAESEVFGITEDGTPYRFTDSKFWSEVDYFDPLKNTIGSISADGGLIWAINTEGEVKYKIVGVPTTTDALGFDMVSILSYRGAVCGINNKAELVMFKNDTKNWDIIEEGVTGITVSPSHLFVTKNDVVYSKRLVCLPE